MIAVFSGVFAALALVFAVIATFSARKSQQLNAEVMRVCSALSNERGRIAAHDAELDQITTTLRKLSGRIGAARREAKQAEADPEVADVNRLTWKAQMREKYGLTPRSN